MRSDLFDKKRTPLIDEAQLSNRVLQEVLTLLLLSKPSKNKNKQRGYISYAQLGINQLGAVYEGLMSYSGLIAADDMVEVAKDGNADKGSWLVPSVKSGDYDEKDLVWREDRLTGRKDARPTSQGQLRLPAQRSRPSTQRVVLHAGSPHQDCGEARAGRADHRRHQGAGASSTTASASRRSAAAPSSTRPSTSSPRST